MSAVLEALELFPIRIRCVIGFAASTIARQS
jgi:hypothetical protein